MRKIDIEKSTIYTSDNASVSLCLKDCSIGQRGYFSNDFTDGDFINDYYLYTGTMEQVIVKKDCKSYFNGMSWFKCFIPEDKLVFIDEHEYRPYSFMYELPFNKVGDVIKIRNKNQELITYTVVNSVSVDKGNNVLHLIIGTTPGTPRYWFDTIEICVNDKWQPFGVEE